MLFLSLIAAIPLSFIAFLVWIFIKKGKAGKIISTLIFVVVGYFVYDAIYPGDQFYKKEFKDITKTDFPESGKIILKKSDYPDIHGDYAACAVAIVSQTDYEKLLKHIERNKKEDTTFIYSDPWNKMEKLLGSKLEFIIKSAEINNKNEFRFWGLLKDGKTVVFYRGSS